MKILLIDCQLAELPAEYEVCVLNPVSAGLMSLRYLLAKEGLNFQPDLLLQRERLTSRIFFSDLPTFECSKIFWSIDSHLNLFWQRWYGQCFDVVLTPHPDLFKALPPEWQVRYDPRSFSMPGYVRDFTPHVARPHLASFVGRLDLLNRPLRSNFVHLLQTKHHVTPCVLPFEAMLDLYAATRILPNEAIADEFNFRIMEGASCGCCVLTKDFADLPLNFEPGKEVLTYRDALEFNELLTFLSTRPTLTEKIGQAARHRVLNSHLLQHRTTAILDLATQLGNRTNVAQAERAIVLTFVQYLRNTQEYATYFGTLRAMLERQGEHPDLVAMLLRVLVENKHKDVLHLLIELTHQPQKCANSFELLTACLSVALRLEKRRLFATFWQMHTKQLTFQPAQSSWLQICFAYAQFLEEAGRVCQTGFQFDPDLHCPETAYEVLSIAKRYIRDSDEQRLWLEKMNLLCTKARFFYSAMNLRAQLSYLAPADWRASLAYALSCLQVYKLEEGLTELQLATELARHAGEEQLFQQIRDHCRQKNFSVFS